MPETPFAVRGVERETGIAAKLYEARTTLRSLFRERYAEKLAPYIEALQRVASESGKGILEVALTTSTAAVESDCPGAALCFLAAAVEILEPSNPASTEGGEERPHHG